MQLSTKARYSVMAMVDLAVQQSTDHADASMCVAEIAVRRQLSQSYLEQLFGKLRRAGLVNSARGPGGGYRLARGATEITIVDIVAAVHEPIRATRCETGSGGCTVAVDPDAAGVRCRTHVLWLEPGRQIALFLGGLSLPDVVSGRVRGRAVSLPAPKAVLGEAPEAVSGAVAGGGSGD